MGNLYQKYCSSKYYLYRGIFLHEMVLGGGFERCRRYRYKALKPFSGIIALEIVLERCSEEADETVIRL